MENYQENIDNPYLIANDAIKIEYTVAPITFYYNYESKKELNMGNKVLLPKIILNMISVYDNLNFPLTIKINDIILGINEILEDIDIIYIPVHFCNKLNITEPTTVNLEFLNHDIVKGTFLKLKPHNSKFYTIRNTKEYLEENIKKYYTHLENNTLIKFPYYDEILYFDVIETKPENIICVIDTELEVDFEKAYDYKEPEKKISKAKFKFSSGVGSTNENTLPKVQEEFKPFSGKGRKLND